MKKEVLEMIYSEMQELSQLVRVDEYFTVLGEFALDSFRKYQWKIYGKIEMVYELGFIEWRERSELKENVRKIGKRYRLKH